ncbi:hypothetical protein EV177_002757, partial [Coemansia sp. RSA 1804]
MLRPAVAVAIAATHPLEAAHAQPLGRAIVQRQRTAVGQPGGALDAEPADGERGRIVAITASARVERHRDGQLLQRALQLLGHGLARGRDESLRVQEPAEPDAVGLDLAHRSARRRRRLALAALDARDQLAGLLQAAGKVGDPRGERAVARNSVGSGPGAGHAAGAKVRQQPPQMVGLLALAATDRAQLRQIEPHLRQQRARNRVLALDDAQQRNLRIRSTATASRIGRRRKRWKRLGERRRKAGRQRLDLAHVGRLAGALGIGIAGIQTVATSIVAIFIVVIVVHQRPQPARIGDQPAALLHQQQRLGVRRQAEPRGRLAVGQRVAPAHKVVEAGALGRKQRSRLAAAAAIIGGIDQRKLGAVRVGAEPARNKRLEHAPVVVAVDAPAIHAGAKQRADRGPRNARRIDVGLAGRRSADPPVNRGARARIVRIAELVPAGPAERRIPQPLDNHRVQPRQQEVQAGALGRKRLRVTAATGVAGVAEALQQIRADARRRLEHEGARAAQQAVRHRRVDLHRQEQAEHRVGAQRLQALLELRKPGRRQVHVLEQHPAAALGRRRNRLPSTEPMATDTTGRRISSASASTRLAASCPATEHSAIGVVAATSTVAISRRFASAAMPAASSVDAAPSPSSPPNTAAANRAAAASTRSGRSRRTTMRSRSATAAGIARRSSPSARLAERGTRRSASAAARNAAHSPASAASKPSRLRIQTRHQPRLRACASIASSASASTSAASGSASFGACAGADADADTAATLASRSRKSRSALTRAQASCAPAASPSFSFSSSSSSALRSRICASCSSSTSWLSWCTDAAARA